MIKTKTVSYTDVRDTHKEHDTQKLDGIYIPSDNEIPRTIATMFARLNSEEMAHFFDQVAFVSNKWDHPQMQWRIMQDDLSPEASNLIKDMFEHTRDE